MNYKITAWALALLMVLIITLYVFEFDHLGNTIMGTQMVGRSVPVAVLLGVYLGYRFQEQGKEQVDKIRIWAACILFPLFFAPLLASMSNRLLARSDVKYQTFEFLEEQEFAASAYGFLQDETVEADGCYLFVFYREHIVRLKREQCSYWQNKRGDQISLPVKKGLWGYEIVMQE